MIENHENQADEQGALENASGIRNQGYTERYGLSLERLRQMKGEETVEEPFRAYFHEMASFALRLAETSGKIEDGSWHGLSLKEMQEWNHRLYADILPENYGRSYADPAYAVSVLGEGLGGSVKRPVYGGAGRNRLRI